MLRSASFRRIKAVRARVIGHVVALGLAACATYEAPTRLGYGDDYEGPTSGKGGADGGGDSKAGKGGSSSGGTSGSGGSAQPQAGKPAVMGGSGGTVTAGGAGMAGIPSDDGGEGGESPGAIDGCPTDPAKTAPGICGCGFPDANTATLASCTGLKSALLHRYDFEGTGTTASDRVGTAHGTIVGGAELSKLGGKGVVVLTGGTTGPYVDLPNELLSSLTSATLEAWVTWGGGDGWQRIFDFGDSSATTPEDNPANGKSYLFLTPSIDPASGGVARAVYSLSGGAAAAETRLDGAAALPQALAQVALVVDATADTLVLYVDGAKAGEQAFTGQLSSINDVNAWLGRSQYNADPELTGTFHDFRIYSAPLTALQIATSFAGGPDPAFLAQ
jgi:hypothetical protein